MGRNFGCWGQLRGAVHPCAKGAGHTVFFLFCSSHIMSQFIQRQILFLSFTFYFFLSQAAALPDLYKARFSTLYLFWFLSTFFGLSPDLSSDARGLAVPRAVYRYSFSYCNVHHRAMPEHLLALSGHCGAVLRCLICDVICED